MTPEQLRQLQAPIKERYRADPSAALQTFRADARLDPSHPACAISTRFATYVAGLHPAAGGDGTEACSGDLLLESLVACAAVTFNVVAIATGISFRSARVLAEGVGDFRGTLGVARDVPVGITQISLRFEVDTDASDEALAGVLRLTERYCVIAQTLQAPPQLVTRVERISC